MSDVVGNSEDRLCRDAAHFIHLNATKIRKYCQNMNNNVIVNNVTCVKGILRSALPLIGRA